MMLDFWGSTTPANNTIVMAFCMHSGFEEDGKDEIDLPMTETCDRKRCKEKGYLSGKKNLAHDKSLTLENPPK